MAKIYDTGKSKWTYGNPCDYVRGISMHKILGPCPMCGNQTFDYGGGWACRNDYCKYGVPQIVCNNGNYPKWWDTDINVMLDGNAWCAYRDGFTNLQESIAGFGDTPQMAINDLIKNEKDDS